MPKSALGYARFTHMMGIPLMAVGMDSIWSPMKVDAELCVTEPIRLGLLA